VVKNLADLFYLDFGDLKANVTLISRTAGNPEEVFGPLNADRVYRDRKGNVNVQFPPFVCRGDEDRIDDFYYNGDHVVQIPYSPPNRFDGPVRHTVTLWSNGRQEPLNYQI
jgi:hypothetical protein